MPGRPRRNLALTFTPVEWDRLLQAALAAERDPWQQARYLILRGLADELPDSADDLATQSPEHAVA